MLMVKKKSQNNWPLAIVVVVVLSIAFLLCGVWMHGLLHPQLAINISSDRSIISRDGVEKYLASRYPNEVFMIEEDKAGAYHSSSCEGEISGLAVWKVTDNRGIVFKVSETVSPEEFVGRLCSVQISPTDDYVENVADKAISLANEDLVRGSSGKLRVANEDELDKYELADKILAYYAEWEARGYIDEVMPKIEIKDNYKAAYVTIEHTDERSTIIDKITEAKE